MGKHRKPGVFSTLLETRSGDSRTGLRNKILAGLVAGSSVVAVGAPFIADAGDNDRVSQAIAPLGARQSISSVFDGKDHTRPAVDLIGTDSGQQPSNLAQLNKSQAIEKDRTAKRLAAAKKAAAEQAAEQAAAKKAAAEQAAEQAAAKKAAAKKAAAKKAAAKKAAAKKAAAEKAAEQTTKLVKQGRITSGYHSRGGAHAGIDIGADMGTPIYAPTGGEVISAGAASGFGLWVRVQHGNGMVTVYGHVNEIMVEVGENVRAGEQIATVGSRGQSTGPHLHFEVRHGAGGAETNPIPWLKNRGVSID